MHRGEKRVVVLVLKVDEVLSLGDLDVGHLSSRKCRDCASLLLVGGAKSYAKVFAWWVSVKQNALAEALNPHLSQGRPPAIQKNNVQKVKSFLNLKNGKPTS